MIVLVQIIAVALIAWFSFRQGERHVAGPLVVRMANNGCFDTWAGLTALNDTNQARLAVALNRDMDFSAVMLAEMSLSHPSLIQRRHYNVLVRVRDYRKKYGRAGEQEPDYNPAEVDRKITDAIAYLESIHNTNEWLLYKTDYDDIILQSRRGR